MRNAQAHGSYRKAIIRFSAYNGQPLVSSDISHAEIINGDFMISYLIDRPLVSSYHSEIIITDHLHSPC